MHLFFSFWLSLFTTTSFPSFLSGVVFISVDVGRPRKGKSRDIAQREHRARMKVNNKILRIYFYRYAELRALWTFARALPGASSRILKPQLEEGRRRGRFIHSLLGEKLLLFFTHKTHSLSFSLWTQLNKSKRSWPRSLAWRRKRRKGSSATEKSVPELLELPTGRELACTEATNTSLCKSSMTTRKRL